MLRTRVDITGPTVGPAVMTMHWGANDDSTSVGSVRTALQAFCVALKTIIHTGSTLVFDPNVDVVDPPSGDITSVFTSTTFTENCTATGVLMPFATQGLIRWRTGSFVDSREVRGRTFIPGVKDASNINGVPQAAYVTSLTSAATALVAASSAQFGIYQRPRIDYRNSKGELLDDRPGSFHVATSGSGWTKWATLRSRRD